MAAIRKRYFSIILIFLVIFLSLLPIINYHNRYNEIVTDIPNNYLKDNINDINIELNDTIHVNEEVKIKLNDTIHENEETKIELNDTIHENEETKIELNDTIHEDEKVQIKLNDTIHEDEKVQIKLNDTIHENEEIKNEVENLILDTLLTSFESPTTYITEFSELKSKMELHTALWNLVFGKYEANEDIDEFIKYKDILINSTTFLSEDNIDDLTKEKKLLVSLHQSLYPWLYQDHFKSLGNIINSSHGKGLVICTGDKHFKYARSTIDSLRNVLHCDLPIEIIYNGEYDLSYTNRDIISEFNDVYLTDISDYFDKKIVNISGWAIKPYALLASRFEEIILIDADVVYLRDPKELFEDEGYIKTGTLFFRDRTINPGPHPGSEWLRSWMTNPLPETKDLRFYNEETMHEMESSTVVLNKTKNILGLLATCKLNEKRIREDVVYKYVYGDKETFWIGFDMARQHYNLNSVPCTYIGKVIENSEGKRICGHIGHMLKNGKFMFWNGHVVKNKGLPENQLELIDFDSYYIDDNKGDWTPDLSCLLLEGKKDPTPLNDDELKILNTILDRERKHHYIIPKME